MPAQHFVGCTGLTGSAASVNIDVYGPNGVLIGNIVNAKIVRVAMTDTYLVDLRQSALGIDLALPLDGDKIYDLVWKSDAPAAIHKLEKVQGLVQLYGEPQRDPVYPSTTIPTRGITSTVIAQEKASYIRLLFSRTFEFESFDAELFLILYYDESGRLERSMPSTTAPNP